MYANTPEADDYRKNQAWRKTPDVFTLYVCPACGQHSINRFSIHYPDRKSLSIFASCIGSDFIEEILYYREP